MDPSKFTLVLRLFRYEWFQDYLSQTNYSQTSMAQTALGPWKFVLDMGSSSPLALIIAPDLEANKGMIKGCLFDRLQKMVC